MKASISDRPHGSLWDRVYAFISGVASVIDITGSQFETPKQPKSDADALFEDWKRLGGDFKAGQRRVVDDFSADQAEAVIEIERTRARLHRQRRELDQHRLEACDA